MTTKTDDLSPAPGITDAQRATGYHCMQFNAGMLAAFAALVEARKKLVRAAEQAPETKPAGRVADSRMELDYQLERFDVFVAGLARLNKVVAEMIATDFWTDCHEDVA